MKWKLWASSVRGSTSSYILYYKRYDDDNSWLSQDTDGNGIKSQNHRGVRRDFFHGLSNNNTWTANLSSFLNLDNCKCQSALSPYEQKEEDSNLQSSLVDSPMPYSSLPVSSLHNKYNIQWQHPLGQGSFGTVYEAIHRDTGSRYAIKRISKKYTLAHAFQHELFALSWVKKSGGHPNICALHECYQDDRYYYLVLDLLSGGEMFDALVERGAYSELDASRIFRDVTSAVHFLHGIGLVHGDIKPENLLLSMKYRDDAVVQITDFGCAHFNNKEKQRQPQAATSNRGGGNTVAYSPPEVLQHNRTLASSMDFSMDIWALGVILYIMLTGLHPFDLTGTATDEEVKLRILKHESPPLFNSPITAHLSSSALDVIDQCLKWDPHERISAFNLLQHPWVRGELANPDKMLHSDKKIAFFRKHKSKVEAKVFANLFSWSTRTDSDNSVYKNASLIERAFHSLDIENKGFLSATDIRDLSSVVGEKGDDMIQERDDSLDNLMSLSQFSNLISENMKNRFFPSGYTLYHEGDTGNHMYFINSGTVELTTLDGVSFQRSQGDFFGEGALLQANKKRSATVRCLTPIHVIEISRQDFEKYAESSNLSWDIKEKDKVRKKNRVKTILRLQKELREIHLNKGDYFFRAGEKADFLYILEKGRAECLIEDHKVFILKPGDICGEHSLIMGKPRNSSTVCVSDTCIAQQMKAEDFQELYKSISPISQASLRELCLRREFQKALVKKTNKDFPSVDDLRVVFDSASKGQHGYLTINDVRDLLQAFDRTLTEDEMQEILRSIDLDGSGKITFDKFRIIFGIDDNGIISL